MPVQILTLRSLTLRERLFVKPTFRTSMYACSNFKVAEHDATTGQARHGRSILNRHACLLNIDSEEHDTAM